MAEAPFPLPAHRTGRADFPHPALGQELMLSPTGSSWYGRSSGSGPARRAGTGRGIVWCPDSCTLCLPSKPLTEPMPRVAVNGSIGWTDRAEAEVVRPAQQASGSVGATRSSTVVHSHRRSVVSSLISPLEAERSSSPTACVPM